MNDGHDLRPAILNGSPVFIGPPIVIEETSKTLHGGPHCDTCNGPCKMSCKLCNGPCKHHYGPISRRIHHLWHFFKQRRSSKIPPARVIK